jgi:carbonic anhydrase
MTSEFSELPTFDLGLSSGFEEDVMHGSVRARAGVKVFQEVSFAQHADLYDTLSTGQKPHSLFISCSDSRIVPAWLTASKPGDFFVVRNVGNLVPAYVTGQSSPEAAAIEYALGVLGIEHVVICGHSNCGAMKAVLGGSLPEDSPLSPWLSAAPHEFAKDLRSSSAGEPEVGLRRLAEQNVRTQMEHLKSHPAAERAAAEGRLTVSGWYYDIGRGQVWSVPDSARESAVPVINGGGP